jgi:hypothetical protein
MDAPGACDGGRWPCISPGVVPHSQAHSGSIPSRRPDENHQRAGLLAAGARSLVISVGAGSYASVDKPPVATDVPAGSGRVDQQWGEALHHRYTSRDRW